jgi:hypothetical protein
MRAKLFEAKNAGDKGKGLLVIDPIPEGNYSSFECPRCIRISKDDFELALTNKEKSINHY